MEAPTAAWGLLVVFSGSSAVHLAVVAKGDRVRAVLATKPIPVLCLIGLALVLDRPWTLLLALACSVIADVLLEFDRLFLAGLTMFGMAHVAYVALFVDAGSRILWPVVIACVLAYGLLLPTCWRWLGGSLRLPVAVYGVVLSATTIASAGHGSVAGLGGALFFVSDSLIAARLAGLRRSARLEVCIMATYFAAQLLLLMGSAESSGFGLG